MLVLCYGIPKSGSTLAFELVKGVLESVGHRQERLPDGPVNRHRRMNFLEPVDESRVKTLIAAIGQRSIAVKTHSGMSDALFPFLENLQAARQVQIIASYRDPRDICLSLVDAGVKARAKGRKEFSETVDIASAVPRVVAQIAKFRKWASVRGALRLDYDTVAFATDTAIDQIEKSLGIVSDRARAKEHAFTDAFTQRNKAKRKRFEEELTEAQKKELTAKFAPFIRNVCEGKNDQWFLNYRQELLAKLGHRAIDVATQRENLR